MTKLPPPPGPPPSWARRIIVGVFVIVVVIVVLPVVSVVLKERAAHQAFLAEQRRLQELEKQQKPFLDAALSGRTLLNQRMNVDRIRRVQFIADSTGMPPVLVNEKFGWFIGLDDSIVTAAQAPEGIDQISWWGFKEDLAKRFVVLSPPADPVDRVGKVMASIGGNSHPCDEYLAMNTEQAVDMLIRQGPNHSVEQADQNPKLHESKYDRIGNETPHEEEIFDEVAKRIAMRPQIAFAWLIEREMLASPGGSIEMATGRVIDFVAEAIDRRINFMIKGLGPVGKVATPPPKP